MAVLENETDDDNAHTVKSARKVVDNFLLIIWCYVCCAGFW